jgi:hypothetical protein
VASCARRSLALSITALQLLQVAARLGGTLGIGDPLRSRFPSIFHHFDHFVISFVSFGRKLRTFFRDRAISWAPRSWAAIQPNWWSKKDCRAHDHPDLFILGSSVFPTPTSTIAALALRAAETIETRLKAK